MIDCYQKDGAWYISAGNARERHILANLGVKFTDGRSSSYIGYGAKGEEKAKQILAEVVNSETRPDKGAETN